MVGPKGFQEVKKYFSLYKTNNSHRPLKMDGVDSMNIFF